METRRRTCGAWQSIGRECSLYPRHGQKSGNQLCQGWRRKALGWHRHHSANAKTGAHNHGPLESVIYVIKGRARMRWGDRLEFTAEAGPGDFIYVPPFVPHQEINASPTEVLECVLCRSDGQAVSVNLDIEPIEKPEQVLWIDPTHPHGGV